MSEQRPAKAATAAKLALCCVLAGLLVAALMFPLAGGVGVVAMRTSDSVTEDAAQLVQGDPPGDGLRDPLADQGPLDPNPREALATAQAIATRFPQRCLWGSDWPHTPPHPVWQGAPPPPSPFRPVDAGALFDTFFSGIDAALRHMILCEVPARLYGGNVGSKAVEGAGR